MTAEARREELWLRIPGLPAPRALTLLAVEELAQFGRSRLEGYSGPSAVDAAHPIEPSEIAAITGLSLAAAGNHLRDLADAELVRREYGLTTPEPGKAPRVKVGYLPASSYSIADPEVGIVPEPSGDRSATGRKRSSS